jgi:hypothetical protein
MTAAVSGLAPRTGPHGNRPIERGEHGTHRGGKPEQIEVCELAMTMGDGQLEELIAERQAVSPVHGMTRRAAR